MGRTSIYFAPYHSQPGACLAGSSGLFRRVEEAIASCEWPYDNGDDPSFHAARRGNPLTWGVCRQNVRNSKNIQPGTIVVFFAFTRCDSTVFYRLSAVATVKDVLNRCELLKDTSFHQSRYLNLLIAPKRGGWEYQEDGRLETFQHTDWLWRIAAHGRSSRQFNAQYERVYKAGWFRDGEVPIASNYVVFSNLPGETYIAGRPPRVAAAKVEKGIGHHEKWENSELRKLTLDVAAQFGSTRTLRTANASGRNVHPVIRFRMPADEAIEWRRSLVQALQGAERSSRFKFCSKMKLTLAAHVGKPRLHC